MIITLLTLVLLGLACGWLLWHWLALGFLSLAMSVVYLALAPWDLMLFPRWFGVLALLQGSYLVGLAVRTWSDDSQDRTDNGSRGGPAGFGESSSRGGSE